MYLGFLNTSILPFWMVHNIDNIQSRNTCSKVTESLQCEFMWTPLIIKDFYDKLLSILISNRTNLTPSISFLSMSITVYISVIHKKLNI